MPFSDTRTFCGVACSYVCPAASLGGAVAFTITACVAWNLVQRRKMCSIVKNFNFLDPTVFPRLSNSVGEKMFGTKNLLRVVQLFSAESS